MNSPVSLGVSPAAASTFTGVFNQWLEASFPQAGTLGCEVCHLVHQLQPHWPAAALPTLLHNLAPRWVCQPLPCRKSSLPLLQVWMNVSSLSPWLSDFHAVRFSVSSGCFLFLNCCCPSFGCARRHSVSTYASILAGSSETILYFFSTCMGVIPYGRDPQPSSTCLRTLYTLPPELCLLPPSPDPHVHGKIVFHETSPKKVGDQCNSVSLIMIPAVIPILIRCECCIRNLNGHFIP